MSTNRRLAAIMVADVVGYSRMMEQDEAGTLAALKERRKGVFEPVVKAHGGRIVKVMGDGVLVEFGSAVNAVQGAIELQKQMATANENVEEAKRIVLRIGINLGDVIGEGSDIYGEGVNIAARLEALALPGGVLVSSTVYEQTKNKLNAAFEDAGLQSLKNISEPMRVYRVVARGMPAIAIESATRLPIVAVLPFDNMSGDPEQEYFSDGLTEDIIAQLSRFRSLFVIARNSSFVFKGQAADLREIGRKLGAHYIIEGSVRKAGGRIRITAQLIDTTTGSHVWSERFDRSLDDIFAIQDEVTAGIVGKAAGQVQVAGIESARRRTGSRTAYDYYLRGLEHVRRGGAEDTAPAVENFSRAIEEDRNFAQAYALLSHAQINYAMSLWAVEDYEGALERALESAQRSIALDGNDARCHAALGQAHFAMKRFDLAEYYIARAQMLNPYDPDIVALQCYLAAYGDKPAEALSFVEFAQKLSPLQPNWYYEPWGVALYQLRRYAEAAEVFERALASQPYALRYLAACYAQLGDLAKARAIAEKSLNLQPDFSLQKWQAYEQYKSEAGLLHMLEGLRKAGLPE